MGINVKRDLHLPAPKRGFKPENGWVIAYTDGGANPNNGSGWGGSGVFVYTDEDHEYVVSRALPKGTTNNIAELYGFIDAARLALHLKKPYLAVYPDSKYLISGIEGWLKGWKNNGWKRYDRKTKTMLPIKNEQIWRKIDMLLGDLKAEGIKLSLSWVKGHSGVYGNEVADVLAGQGIERAVNGHEDVLMASGRKVDPTAATFYTELDEGTDIKMSEDDWKNFIVDSAVSTEKGTAEKLTEDKPAKPSKKPKYPTASPMVDSKLLFITVNDGNDDYPYIYGFHSNRSVDKDRGPLEMVGCHNASTRLSVVKTDTAQPPLEAAIEMLTHSIRETVPVAIDWTVLTKKSNWDEICEEGKEALRFNRSKLRLRDATEVARMANPPGLVYMATDIMDTMVNSLEEYLEGKYLEGEMLHDITDSFFVEDKKGYIFNPEIDKAATYHDVVLSDAELDSVTLRLSFGLNLPSRPAMQRIAKASSSLKVYVLQVSKNNHSFGQRIIIHADSDVGVYLAPYASRVWIL